MKMFAAKVEEGKKGRDGQPSVGPIYRNLISEHEFPPTDPNLTTAWEMFSASVEQHPGNRMLGWRQYNGGKWGPYVWKTYKEVYGEVLCAGSALRAHGIQPGARVGIYGSNCPEWIVAMQACGAHSLICVPLYDTLGPGAVNYIIDHAEIDFVFVQDKKVKNLLSSECTHARRLKLIVCFSTLTEEEKDKAASIGVKSYSWHDFLQLGKEKQSRPLPPRPLDICTIMYTSGTSGNPKGVILTHENMTSAIRGVDVFMEQFEDKDIDELRDDLMELKPTFLAGVPRVFERIHEGVLKALEELNPVRRRVFDMLYKHKLNWMMQGYKHRDASRLADLLAFRKVKARLGGRIRLIVSGGAPLSREVEEFLRVTSCAFVLQGYGLTETCGLATLGFPDEMGLIGTVGAAFVYTEMRLEEVPEMGYDPLGDPPRGEICVRGKTSFAGYYKNPELTSESMRDGWFHTGDIGEMFPNGVVKIIDRKKNLIKLSQGEYVALEYLEKVYCITPIIEDIWVYGDSFKSALVAVVVPNEENTKRWAQQSGYKGSFSELCTFDLLREHIILELRSTAQRNKLRGFEYINGVLLEPQPFEFQKDLVTATLKKRRDRLLKQYKVEIDHLYGKMASAKR